jgi:tetratricopeptide (TPR) repeat protein
MKLSSTLFACTMTLSLVGCAGRTAYWEAKSSDGAGDAKAADAVAAAPADEAWAGRAEEANVRKAIALWEGALGCKEGDGSPESRCDGITVDASTVQVMSNLTHAYYFLADGFLRAKEKEYLSTMDRGVWWGERALAGASPEFAEKMANKAKFYEAIKVVPKEGIEAMYWYAACLGKWAKRTSFAVLLGQKDNIKATMERVLELDPEFFHGAAHRYFGAYYAIAPGFAGGDPKKSEEHFQKSLEKAPYYLGTKVLIAEHLATKLDDEERFKKELQEVIDADPNATAGLEPESKIEQEKAKELLENIDEFF